MRVRAEEEGDDKQSLAAAASGDDDNDNDDEDDEGVLVQCLCEETDAAALSAVLSRLCARPCSSSTADAVLAAAPLSPHPAVLLRALPRLVPPDASLSVGANLCSLAAAAGGWQSSLGRAALLALSSLPLSSLSIPPDIEHLLIAPLGAPPSAASGEPPSCCSVHSQTGAALLLLSPHASPSADDARQAARNLVRMALQVAAAARQSVKQTSLQRQLLARLALDPLRDVVNAEQGSAAAAFVRKQCVDVVQCHIQRHRSLRSAWSEQAVEDGVLQWRRWHWSIAVSLLSNPYTKAQAHAVVRAATKVRPRAVARAPKYESVPGNDIIQYLLSAIEGNGAEDPKSRSGAMREAVITVVTVWIQILQSPQSSDWTRAMVLEFFVTTIRHAPQGHEWLLNEIIRRSSSCALSPEPRSAAWGSYLLLRATMALGHHRSKRSNAFLGDAYEFVELARRAKYPFAQFALLQFWAWNGHAEGALDSKIMAVKKMMVTQDRHSRLQSLPCLYFLVRQETNDVDGKKACHREYIKALADMGHEALGLLSPGDGLHGCFVVQELRAFVQNAESGHDGADAASSGNAAAIAKTTKGRKKKSGKAAAPRAAENSEEQDVQTANSSSCSPASASLSGGKPCLDRVRAAVNAMSWPQLLQSLSCLVKDKAADLYLTDGAREALAMESIEQKLGFRLCVKSVLLVSEFCAHQTCGPKMDASEICLLLLRALLDHLDVSGVPARQQITGFASALHAKGSCRPKRKLTKHCDLKRPKKASRTGGIGQVEQATQTRIALTDLALAPDIMGDLRLGPSTRELRGPLSPSTRREGSKSKDPSSSSSSSSFSANSSPSSFLDSLPETSESAILFLCRHLPVQYVATSLLEDFGFEPLVVASALATIVKTLAVPLSKAQGGGKEQSERVTELMVRALETAAICIQSKLDGTSIDADSCKQLFKDTVGVFLEEVHGVMKTSSGSFVMSDNALRLIGALAYLNEGAAASGLAVNVLQHVGLVRPFSTAQDSHHSLLIRFGSIAARTSSGRGTTILSVAEIGSQARECHVHLALIACAMENQHESHRKTLTREGVSRLLAYTSLVLQLESAIPYCSIPVLAEFTQVVSSTIQRGVEWLKQQEEWDRTIASILADLRGRLRAMANVNKEQQGKGKSTSFRLVLLRLVSLISDSLGPHEAQITDIEDEWEKRAIGLASDHLKQDSSTVGSFQGETHGEYLEPSDSDSDESEYSFG